MPGRPNPAIHDVDSYLDAVREAFHNEPAKYDEVNKIFTDFQTNRVNVGLCLVLLEPLFEDHLNLLRGFKYFTPDADETEGKINALFFIREVQVQNAKTGNTYYQFWKKNITGANNGCCVFLCVADLKKEFVDEPAKYEEFTKIMLDIVEDGIDTASTNARVMEIIKDHENLVHSYMAIGPPPVQPTNPNPINDAEQQQTDESLDKKD